MKIKRYGLLAGCLLLMASAYGSDLRKVEVMGKQYYIYEVKKGDTMYGLSRSLGWDPQVMEKYNPGEFSPLDKGALIYYPVSAEIANAKNPQTVKHGQNTVPLKHQIQRGETLSSISRMYGVSVDRLRKLNPGSSDGIKAGEWLTVSESGKTSYHTIQKGETIYGVAKASDVSVEALLKANPGISESNFRAGDVIHIPAPGTGIVKENRLVKEENVTGFKDYKVNKKDTWQSIARNYNIPMDVLKAANNGIELKPKKYIGIPVIQVIEVEREVAREDTRENSPEGIQQIYNDVHGIADEQHPNIRMAVLVDDPMAKRDREFMRGVLLGINDEKYSGAKIDLKMIDASKGSLSAEPALETFSPTVILVTSENGVPDWIGNYSKTNMVPVVNSLDVKSDAYQTNPMAVQLITPPDYFNDGIASWVADQYAGYTLVFTGEEDRDDALAQALKDNWDSGNVRSRSIEDLKTLPLNANGKYLIYSYPTKKNAVSDFLDAVNEAMVKTPLATVSVIGRPNWIVYDKALSSKLHNANVQIPARFYVNDNERNTQEFKVAYRQMFDGTVPNTFPVYAIVGYDTTTYLINGLVKTGGDINKLAPSSDTLQTPIVLSRPSNWSGLLNTAVYMVRFTPYDTIEKNVIK